MELWVVFLVLGVLVLATLWVVLRRRSQSRRSEPVSRPGSYEVRGGGRISSGHIRTGGVRSSRISGESFDHALDRRRREDDERTSGIVGGSVAYHSSDADGDGVPDAVDPSPYQSGYIYSDPTPCYDPPASSSSGSSSCSDSGSSYGSSSGGSSYDSGSSSSSDSGSSSF